MLTTTQYQQALLRFKKASTEEPTQIALYAAALWKLFLQVPTTLSQLLREWLLLFTAKVVADKAPKLRSSITPWDADEWKHFHVTLKILRAKCDNLQTPADKEECQRICTALMDIIRQAINDERWEQAVIYASKFLLNRRWYDQTVVKALLSDVDSFLLLNEADADNWIAQRSEALPSYAETKAPSPLSPANPLEEEQEEWPRIRAEIDHIYSEGGTMRDAVKVNVRLFLEGKHTLSQKAGEYIRSLGFPPAGDREAEFGNIDALESIFSTEVDQLSIEEKTSDS